MNEVMAPERSSFPASVERLLRLLLKHPRGLTRPAIAQETGLAQNTVASLLKPGKTLRDTGLVVEEQDEQAGGNGGPRPWRARINSYGLYVACVEVAHGHVRCGLADVFGRLLPASSDEAAKDGRRYTQFVGKAARDDPPFTLDFIENALCERLQAVFEYEREQMEPIVAKHHWMLRDEPAVVSVGISAAGPVDPRNGKLRCANPRDDTGFSCGAWRGTSINHSLEARLRAKGWDHCDFFTGNDANLCAEAELRDGVLRQLAEEQRHPPHAIVVKWTGGLGGALVVEGKVYVGFEGFAGEFGHSLLEPDDPLTLGQRVGIAGISRKLLPDAYAKYKESDPDELLRDWFDQKVLAYARADKPLPGTGDKAETPRNEVRRAARELGTALVPLVDMLNPQVIVISGGIFTSKDRSLIVDPLVKSLREGMSPISSHEVDVVFGRHERHPAMDGAIASRLGAPQFPSQLLSAASATAAVSRAA